MKSITKKVVALSATFAMAASVAASAATIDSVTVADGATAGSITVNYTSTGLASDAQATILVYEGETPFVNGTGDNVGYINQDAATGSFTFAMRDSLVPAAGTQKTYNVKIGGTDVAVAGSATITLGEAAATTYSISGTVGDVMNFGDGEFAADTEAYAASIDVCDENWNTLKTVSIDVSSINPDIGIGSVPFTVDGLEFGKKYYLYFMRAGACDKQITLSSTVAADIKNVNVELWAGDPSKDTIIDGTDVGIALAKAKANAYDIECDANADTFVDGTDIGIMLGNARRFSSYSIVIE